jgi:hypothetical protein
MLLSFFAYEAENSSSLAARCSKYFWMVCLKIAVDFISVCYLICLFSILLYPFIPLFPALFQRGGDGAEQVSIHITIVVLIKYAAPAVCRAECRIIFFACPADGTAVLID